MMWVPKLLSVLLGLWLPVDSVFSEGLSRDLKQKGWKVHHFVEGTRYQFVDGYIRAEAKAAASGLIREKKVDIAAQSLLQWRWKLPDLLSAPFFYDEQSTSGDDFSARVYVVAKNGLFNRSYIVSYVWSAQHAEGVHWASPYTDATHIVVVESGSANLNQWRMYRRDIRADFKQAFNIEIDEIVAVAIMTDTDNTKGYATALYGDIQFLAE